MNNSCIFEQFFHWECKHVMIEAWCSYHDTIRSACRGCSVQIYLNNQHVFRVQLLTIFSFSAQSCLLALPILVVRCETKSIGLFFVLIYLFPFCFHWSLLVPVRLLHACMANPSSYYLRYVHPQRLFHISRKTVMCICLTGLYDDIFRNDFIFPVLSSLWLNRVLFSWRVIDTNLKISRMRPHPLVKRCTRGNSTGLEREPLSASTAGSETAL